MKLCTVETAIEITNDYIFSPLLLYQTLTAQIPVQALALQTHIPELSHSAFLSKTPLLSLFDSFGYGVKIQCLCQFDYALDNILSTLIVITALKEYTV